MRFANSWALMGCRGYFFLLNLLKIRIFTDSNTERKRSPNPYSVDCWKEVNVTR